MNINEAKQILNDVGYILYKNPVCNEGILHNIGNFAKRTVLGDTKLEQLIQDADDDVLRKVLRSIYSALKDYAYNNQETYNQSIDKIMQRFGNDDKLINAIKQISEMSAHDITIALHEEDKDEARKILKRAGNKIISIINHGY